MSTTETLYELMELVMKGRTHDILRCRRCSIVERVTKGYRPTGWLASNSQCHANGHVWVQVYCDYCELPASCFVDPINAKRDDWAAACDGCSIHERPR